MATVQYAMKITLVDSDNGQPVVRCWGPVFEVVDGVPSDPGWHHFIVSFDASVPRVQMAMDRGGGPILGGGVMDTNTGTGVIDASGGFPSTDDFVAGEMYARLEASSLNGFAPSPGILVGGLTAEDINWNFRADARNVTDFAYCYFGVKNTFFDLKGTTGGVSNLNFFVTPGLAPVNLGVSGGAVTPLVCWFMHTGDADNIPDPDSPPVAAWQPTFSYNFGDYVTTTGGGQTRYWIAQQRSIFGPNIGHDPLTSGLSLQDQIAGVTVPPLYFWREVYAPLVGPEFRWNAATAVLAPINGLISTTDGP